MVFSSVTFLFYFFPLFYLIYYLSRGKNSILIVFSLLFYFWGESVYIYVLLLSILINYAFGLIISSRNLFKKKIILSIGIGLNIVLIGYYKYFLFLANTSSTLWQFLGFAGFQASPVHLPIGLSFFTFQGISYLIDVFRGEIMPERKVSNYLLYVAMFPHQIAGPIVRFKTICEDIRHRQLTPDKTISGVMYFIVGLSQKVLVANVLAQPVDRIFAFPISELSPPVAWTAVFFYTLQIYFDFCGYSNMAIGLSLLMGFTFPPNFNYPYIAVSITEFWRRWHISLSTWLRDYVYIPLGGNRTGPLRTYLNLFLVFFICGLWHGANWTFIFWGMYHGIFLVVERLGLKKILGVIPVVFQHAYTLLVVAIGWAIFRSDSLSYCLGYLKVMFFVSPWLPDAPSVFFFTNNYSWVVFIIGVILSTPISTRFFTVLPEMKNQYSLLFRSEWVKNLYYVGSMLLLIFSLVLIGAGTYNPFIYYRF